LFIYHFAGGGEYLFRFNSGCPITFATVLVPRRLFAVWIKREVRCNSGAIPVAVSLLKYRQLSHCSKGWEGRREIVGHSTNDGGKPEDLPESV
jgi:hypothetical protein